MTNCVSSLSLLGPHTQTLCVFLLRRTSSLRFSPSVRRRFDYLLGPTLDTSHVLSSPHSRTIFYFCTRSYGYDPLYEPPHLLVLRVLYGALFINVDVFGFKYLSINVFTSFIITLFSPFLRMMSFIIMSSVIIKLRFLD